MRAGKNRRNRRLHGPLELPQFAASEAAQHLESVPHGDFFQHLMRDALCGVLLHMADEKSNKSKNTILWIITVVLIALAIFLYKR